MPFEVSGDYTLVVMLRHGHHNKQVLSGMARVQANAAGRVLKRMGITLHTVGTSPELRCVSTAVCCVEGNDSQPFFKTDFRLADAKSDPRLGPDLIDKLKAEAKETGMEPEEHLLTSPDLRTLMLDRGELGAQAVRDIVLANPGEHHLISSHGGSRLEVTTLALQGKLAEFADPSKRIEPDFTYSRGCMAFMLFRGPDLIMCHDMGDLGREIYSLEMKGSDIYAMVSRGQTPGEHPAHYGLHGEY